MDSKRFVLALVLSVAVIFAVQTFFPSASRSKTTNVVADSTATKIDSTTIDSASEAAKAANLSVPPPVIGAADSGVAGAGTGVTAGAASAIVPQLTTVKPTGDSGAVFTLNNIGAAPVSVVMNSYKFATSTRLGEQVKLEVANQALLKYRLVIDGTTTDLSTTPFAVTQSGSNVTYRGSAANHEVTFQYEVKPDSHEVHVTGSVPNVAAGYLVVDLPTTLPATEKDTAHDLNELGFAYMSKRDGARRVLFRSLDPGETQPLEGPVDWVAVKTKYFVFGLLAPENGQQFAEATLAGGVRTSSKATNASGSIVVPIKDGAFAFDIYAGPQEWKRLRAQGREFDQVNPYGWAFLRGVLQPIATMVIRLVLWMHSQLHLSYGMVLVLLGFLVRVILWPLNQTAMKTSLKMQELQPELQAVQKKYKDNIEVQRKEIMKLYQAHGMSPFSPIMGCLPMLLPMPVLFALFFVFQNTIEFRGVSFMWVTDLSAYDPYFVWPILMAVSMFLLSWIGMRNSPPNPQTKMMAYVMPVMLLIFLSKMAAGLNVYYAAQNIAALPQQWLIARKQAKRRAEKEGGGGVAATVVGPTGSKTSKGSKGDGRRKA